MWLDLKVDGVGVSDNFVSFAKPKHLELVKPDIRCDIKDVEDKIQATLTSDIPALWVWLELEGIDARYSDNFFHLWHGHPVTVTITPEEQILLEEMGNRLKVRSLVDTYK